MNKAALIILDGWANGPDYPGNAILRADTSFYNILLNHWPHSELKTSGKSVGLPPGQMGNSEVGHLNIGTGRVVLQDLMRINSSLQSGDLNAHSIIKDITQLEDQTIHIWGLISDGGVHSHIDHLLGLIDLLHAKEVKNVYIHCVTDGRDTDPHSAGKYIQKLEQSIKNTTFKIATVIGRYYAMDRDKRWTRTSKAAQLYVNGKGVKCKNALSAIRSSYEDDVSDEFIKPHLINKNGILKEGDVFFSYNFRADRPRQLIQVLTGRHDIDIKVPQLRVITITPYSKEFPDVEVLFEKDNIKKPLGEIVANHGGSQLRIAETEKYAHVTYFFNGGVEHVYDGEDRILIPSPKVATYDLQPEMNAREMTLRLIKYVRKNIPDFICLNYANPDMVGHSGDLRATVKAVETVNICLSDLIPVLIQNDYRVVIIADHGNADYMINEDGSPNTAHTTNPVPCLIMNAGCSEVKNGILADVAPTILSLMDLPIPEEMTGQNLCIV